MRIDVSQTPFLDVYQTLVSVVTPRPIAWVTTIDRDTAKRAGVVVSPRPDQFVRTGNGIIRVSSGRAAELEVGGITRSDVGLQVADNDDLNVLGMNFLSSLTRWGVEGRWLVLVS